MFKISAICPEGHMIMTRNTPFAGAGFGNVRIADRMGLLHTPETFERFFVKRASNDDALGSTKPGPELFA